MVEANIRALGDAVETLADGDESVVWASGFSTLSNKSSAKVANFVPPVNFAVGNVKGQSGAVSATWDRVKKVQLYQIEWRKFDSPDVLSGSQSTKKIERILTGLDPKVVYVFRICSINENEEQSAWSEDVSLFVE